MTNNKFNANCEALKKSSPVLADIISKLKNTDNSCYSAPVIAKNGEQVPALKDGKPLFSAYNPSRDADNFLKDINLEENHFIAVSSLANAAHFKKTLQSPNIHILAIEKNAESIATLFKHFDFTDILKNKNFSLCCIENLEDSFRNSYVPQLNGNFSHLALRPWVQYNAEAETEIQQILRKCLENISADYSVQAHFAKVWQRNILRNLRTLSRISCQKHDFPLNKIAAIIGAGPSLDGGISFLKANRESRYIIATDTAWRILLQNGITADAVVTIDGQNISYRHFIDKFPDDKTLFVADLCSHPAIAEKAFRNGNSIQFIASNHPLCLLAMQYAQQHEQYFPPKIDTTSGTVTIAALDFAVKCGFKEIELFGADFAYTNSKAYAKGSYLDSTFENDSTIINSKETTFNALMFRTPVLRKDKSTVTTEVLNRYAQALDDYLKNCKSNLMVSKFSAEGFTTILENKSFLQGENVPIFLPKTLYKSFDYADFIVWLLDSLENHDPALTAAVLPLAAWCERTGIYKSSSNSIESVFDYAYKMAKKQTM